MSEPEARKKALIEAIDICMSARKKCVLSERQQPALSAAIKEIHGLLMGADWEPLNTDSDSPVDLRVCPGCGGVADQGHDRELPPNPYFCTKCCPCCSEVGQLRADKRRLDWLGGRLEGFLTKQSRFTVLGIKGRPIFGNIREAIDASIAEKGE